MITREKLEQLATKISDLEAEMSRPEVATNPAIMQELLRDHKHTKKLHDLGAVFLDLQQQAEEAMAMAEDPDLDDELKEMAQLEAEELTGNLPEAEKNLKFALLPPDPDDERDVILEIRAGTGGDEGALVAGDLFRMYQRYEDQNGWKLTLMDSNASEVGGYKEVIASLQGESVYKEMKYESGVHRVQRVPATEASGRIHTSAATVAVLPEAEEVDEVDIPAEDIRIDVFRASGPGGQSVNTTDSAIRITHLPTGVIVQCQDEKSQHRNKEKAMKVLQARLLDHQRQEEAAKRAGDRKSMIGTGDRSERIRTYNYPQNRITDHRIGLTLYHLDRVMEGEVGQLVEPLAEHDLEDRLRHELDEQS